jgi:hypothetical protein
MSWYIEQMESLTPEYGVHEWIIENQAYSSWLIEDERVKKFSASRGIPVRGHYTSRNKTDPDWGVQSMAPLFGTLRKQNDTGKLHHNDDNLIHLPDSRQSEGVKALMEQLIVWQPGKLGRQLRQDGPMSLWFAETRARDVIHGRSDQNTHFRNKYASRRSQRKQIVVPLDEYRTA